MGTGFCSKLGWRGELGEAWGLHTPPTCPRSSRAPGRRGPSLTSHSTRLPAWRRLVLQGPRQQHSPCPQPWRPAGHGWKTRSALLPPYSGWGVRARSLAHRSPSGCLCWVGVLCW